MNVHSLSYFALVTVIWIAVTFLSRAPARRGVLLVASYLFYATWSLSFTLLLLACSVFNYAWGRVLRHRPTALVLSIGLSVDIGVLLSFKYADALVALVVTEMRENPFGGLIPIGISFYSFQAMSYLIDVYRGYEKRPALNEFLLYMAFWPYILSGPISRITEMLPQFRQSSRLSRQDLIVGIRRIITGLFLKIVLADTLASGIRPGEGVTAGFDQVSSGWGGFDVWILAIGFGFQIFFDFAGYSHIAIGCARLFGIRLRENFNDPYLARTPVEFWSRWHMSLSSWIRDYLFFPLALQRNSSSWRSVMLVFSMMIFGSWHGVGSTFLLWGIYQGLLLVAYRQLQQVQRTRFLTINWPKWVSTALSWGMSFVFISVGWLLFRANSLTQAILMIRTLLSPTTYMKGIMEWNLYLLVGLVVAGYFGYIAGREMLCRWQFGPYVSRFLWLVSPVYRATVLLWVIIWSEKASPFVYVQF